LGKIVDGVSAIATLIGASGVKIAGEITETMAGAATAGVTIAGTMAGVGIAGEPVTAVGGRTTTLAGGIIVSMIVAGGAVGTITAGGTTAPTIDAGVGTGGGTSATEMERASADARVSLLKRVSKRLLAKVDS
jgi:hypothetical protein